MYRDMVSFFGPLSHFELMMTFRPKRLVSVNANLLYNESLLFVPVYVTNSDRSLVTTENAHSVQNLQFVEKL